MLLGRLCVYRGGDVPFLMMVCSLDLVRFVFFRSFRTDPLWFVLFVTVLGFHSSTRNDSWTRWCFSVFSRYQVKRSIPELHVRCFLKSHASLEDDVTSSFRTFLRFRHCRPCGSWRRWIPQIEPFIFVHIIETFHCPEYFDHVASRPAFR